MADAPPITLAVPDVSHPLIDRHRKPSVLWYPYLKKIAEFVQGVAAGELIVDGAVVTRILAADAVTADILAANSVTAGNAAIASAAVTTLSIAGNAVTQAVSASAPTQVAFSATSMTNVLTQAITLTGSQPLLVWGCMTVGGATSVGSPGDYYYEGLYWQNNAGDQPIEIEVTIDGQTSDAILTTVPAGQAQSVPFAFVFTGLNAGADTIALRARLTPYSYSIGIRDVTVAGLETKR